MVEYALRASRFYEHESCGKCTPCRVGTRWLSQILEKIEDGHGTQHDLDLLLDVCDRVNGKCLCSARRLRRARRRQLPRPLPRRVPGAHRPGTLPTPDSPFTTCSRPSFRSSAASIASCTSFLHERGAVTVTVDGRAVEVTKGTGLVETAAAAGIEIPVFCYEPRLGPPVGACRMCLVEVEGLPELQAGCTLTAQDGMVVRTAAVSEKAAEGQNATLEFILVNHLLDCPVCAKWVASARRMTSPSVTARAAHG